MLQNVRSVGLTVVVVVAAIACSSDSPTVDLGNRETLIAVGDIASCASDGDEATAALVDGIQGTIIIAGDLAYESGTAKEFADCYDPSWGRHRSRTRPAPGNHEYETPNAAAYYAYFGTSAGPPGLGYYSFDLGAWHIISLNSNVDASAGSAQEKWLRADLAANSAHCTLAYWHYPVFSSGLHGNIAVMKDVFHALYEFNADVVITGHDHHYERFGPQTVDAVPDAARGIREFVVGTGGRSLTPTIIPRPNSEKRYFGGYGVLRLELDGQGYSWEFVPVTAGVSVDSGSGVCH